MFTKEYEITLCANKYDVVKDLGAMDCISYFLTGIEKAGSIGHVYSIDKLMFYGFTSIKPVNKVVELLKQRVYKADIYAVGGTIFLTFK